MIFQVSGRQRKGIMGTGFLLVTMRRNQGLPDRKRPGRPCTVHRLMGKGRGNSNQEVCPGSCIQKAEWGTKFWMLKKGWWTNTEVLHCVCFPPTGERPLSKQPKRSQKHFESSILLMHAVHVLHIFQAFPEPWGKPSLAFLGDFGSPQSKIHRNNFRSSNQNHSFIHTVEISGLRCFQNSSEISQNENVNFSSNYTFFNSSLVVL